MKLTLADTFTTALPADPIEENFRRQVTDAAFSFVQPRVPTAPKLIHVSSEMLTEIGLSEGDANSDLFTQIVTGAKIYPNTKPYAMCYAGHQFGNWAGQLGDGRAINLMEVLHQNKRWVLQLKGAGATPYSRSADGLAVLRSSIREHLCSEAMHHLGVPTTRSLSLALTGDMVLRDILYNGNPAYEKGAIVCRLAPSFLRFGNYQLFMARKDVKNLKLLTDYTIQYYYPHIQSADKTAYLQFFNEVAERTLEMIIHWQRVGFVHCVMNTDNMSILGLTIDYGPYGWLEGYDPGWTPNTTDAVTKRYRFEQQPNIALWNLMQLGNALYPLIEDVPALEAILNKFQQNFAKQYTQMLKAKIGLRQPLAGDAALIQQLQSNLQLSETDMTIFFRNLALVNKTDTAEKGLRKITVAFYEANAIKNEIKEKWLDWFGQYIHRLQSEQQTDEQRKTAMHQTNPKYVLRNYMAQLAIDAADKGDYSLIEELYQLLKQPYAEQPEYEKWFAKRPEWARERLGCSMLSCSS